MTLEEANNGLLQLLKDIKDGLPENAVIHRMAMDAAIKAVIRENKLIEEGEESEKEWSNLQLSVYKQYGTKVAKNIIANHDCASDAIEALEKQIPRKPDMLCETWVCPNCRQAHEFDYGNNDYCSHCGQRIDWSVEK